MIPKMPAADLVRGGNRFSDKIMRKKSGVRERGMRIRLDPLDHGAEAVRALRRQVFAQPELFEQRHRIGLENFRRMLARIKREQDRDQSEHDMRLAVADE